ncbi:hypothetical protein [Lentilactobacillus parafarraginis]|uniref:hypothetical protein n=1 Tax=Lentilactobacillus parafarraginis TaxID=390842 RepID=UPI00058DEB56|nr:hypothetical protein [Lentilactobacillus parafarraginis]
MKKFIVLLGLLLFGVLLSNNSSIGQPNIVQAKSLSAIHILSNNGSKVKFQYYRQQSKYVHVTKKFTSGVFGSSFNLELKGIRYYNLKPRYNKHTNVRAYFKAQTNNISSLEDSIALFSGSPDYMTNGYGDRLNDLYISGSGRVEINNNDTRSFSVDFTSAKKIPFSHFSSNNNIHFTSDGTQASFPFD